MAHEIERKYLVDVAAWKPRDAGTLYRQGYLSSHAARVVRVRIAGTAGVLTIKGPNSGISRPEFEYPIPLADATELLALCETPLIEKTRHVETHGGMTWEIDVFHGANAGLVVAEIELEAATQSVEAPPWAIREVSDDPRYYNSNLMAHPFSAW